MRRYWVLTLSLFAAGCWQGDRSHEASIPACGLEPARLGDFTTVPEGRFPKGAHPYYPEEQPTLSLHVAAFQMQIHEVTNDQFAAFVEATGYRTDAERNDRLESGSAVFQPPSEGSGVSEPWHLVSSANWRAPRGPGSTIEGLGRYPVVNVSYRDAAAYAKWAGGRLPSEVEWEYAAYLGLPNASDPLSGAYDQSGQPIANTWQGVFPLLDLGDDGFREPAPVGCYAASRVGLYDMIGNVWEWTDTPSTAEQMTIKGGSFLCAENFCRRYRPAAREAQDRDFSTNHIGFRIVRDLPVAR